MILLPLIVFRSRCHLSTRDTRGDFFFTETIGTRLLRQRSFGSLGGKKKKRNEINKYK